MLLSLHEEPFVGMNVPFVLTVQNICWQQTYISLLNVSLRSENHNFSVTTIHWYILVTYYSNGIIALRKIYCIPNYFACSSLCIYAYQEKMYILVKISDSYISVKVKESSVGNWFYNWILNFRKPLNCNRIWKILFLIH